MTSRNLGISALVCLSLLLMVLAAMGTGDRPSAAETKAATRAVLSQAAPAFRNEDRTSLAPSQAGLAARAGLMPPGTKSLLVIKQTLKHGDFVWNDREVPPGDLHIWIDLRRQTISVFKAGHEIGSALIAYGAQGHDTPRGRFAIVSKSRHYRSRRYDAEMPYSLFINDDGIALHSSNLNPRHATHGCIGLPDQFAKQLFDLAPVGTVVEVTASDPELVSRIARTTS